MQTTAKLADDSGKLAGCITSIEQFHHRDTQTIRAWASLGCRQTWAWETHSLRVQAIRKADGSRTPLKTVKLATNTNWTQGMVNALVNPCTLLGMSKGTHTVVLGFGFHVRPSATSTHDYAGYSENVATVAC